jgi:hypothetical protein
MSPTANVPSKHDEQEYLEGMAVPEDGGLVLDVLCFVLLEQIRVVGPVCACARRDVMQRHAAWCDATECHVV